MGIDLRGLSWTTRGNRRQWLTATTAVAALAVGLIAGLAVPADTTEEERVKSQLRRANAQIEKMGSEVAEAEDRAAELASLLDSATADLASAHEEVRAETARLDARKARLERRAKAVLAREKQAAAREAALEPSDLDTSADSTVSGDFDRAYAIDIATDIVEDMKSVDERLGDGIMVSSALSLLADSYGRLLNAGFPPGVEKSTYYGRVTTLQSFAGQAADTFDHNPTEASARYAVIRKETSVLFGILNDALGTQLRVP